MKQRSQKQLADYHDNTKGMYELLSKQTEQTENFQNNHFFLF